MDPLTVSVAGPAARDGHSRDQPFVVLITAPSPTLGLRITGQLVMPAPMAAPRTIALAVEICSETSRISAIRMTQPIKSLILSEVSIRRV